MNPFNVGDKVTCASSDGMDRLIVGQVYTINFIHWSDEVSVEEVPEYVHFTKRFEHVKDNQS